MFDSYLTKFTTIIYNEIIKGFTEYNLFLTTIRKEVAEKLKDLNSHNLQESNPKLSFTSIVSSMKNYYQNIQDNILFNNKEPEKLFQMKEFFKNVNTVKIKEEIFSQVFKGKVDNLKDMIQIKMASITFGTDLEKHIKNGISKIHLNFKTFCQHANSLRSFLNDIIKKFKEFVDKDLLNYQRTIESIKYDIQMLEGGIDMHAFCHITGLHTDHKNGMRLSKNIYQT